MLKILFVCTGNICRSPTAEGFFRALVEQEELSHLIQADSAGTHGYHVGEPPDERASSAALGRDVDIRTQQARKVFARDFQQFDLILAMDRGHLRHLRALAPAQSTAEIRLFMEFAPEFDSEDVPDPYYGGADGFRLVIDMIEAGSAGLLDHIRETHLDTEP